MSSDVKIQFVRTNTFVQTVPTHNASYNWNVLLNGLCRHSVRKSLIRAGLKKDLEAGKKVIVVADRKSFLKYLYYSLRDNFKTSYLHGTVSAADRVTMAQSMAECQLLLATSIVEHFIPSTQSPLPFDTIYLVNPMGSSPFERRVRVGRWFEKESVSIRYYVDEDNWSKALHKKHTAYAEKKGWEIVDGDHPDSSEGRVYGLTAWE